MDTGNSGKGYIYRVTLVATLGGLLFGYDTGVISGAEGYLTSFFGLTSFQEGWAVASALVGCILGAPLAAPVSERFGRKNALLGAALFFSLSALGSALPSSLWQFALARILGGVAVSWASILCPMYIAEISPSGMRGRLVSWNQMAIISGFLVVFLVNAWIANMKTGQWNLHSGWRWMFGSEILPALLFFFLLFLVPESPRWLVRAGREKEALGVLEKTSCGGDVEKEMAGIRASLRRGKAGWKAFFRPGMKKLLFIGLGLSILQQWTGINTIMYYAPKIFEKAGIPKEDAILRTVLVGVVQVTATLVAIRFVDRWGRKPLMLAASAGMGASLAFLGGALVLGSGGGVWVVLFVLAYVAFFGVAMGPVVWVLLSEIFPNRVRDAAMSICVMTLWIANFFVTQFFPPMLKALGGSTFFIYSFLCLVCFFFVKALVPETKGKSLEELESYLGVPAPEGEGSSPKPLHGRP